MNRQQRRQLERQLERAQRRSRDAGPAADGGARAAVQDRQAGRSPQAEETYREILQRQPDHASALPLLDLATFRADRRDQAAHSIAEAIAASPRTPDAHNDQALALRAQGRLAAAAES